MHRLCRKIDEQWVYIWLGVLLNNFQHARVVEECTIRSVFSYSAQHEQTIALRQYDFEVSVCYRSTTGLTGKWERQFALFANRSRQYDPTRGQCQCSPTPFSCLLVCNDPLHRQDNQSSCCSHAALVSSSPSSCPGATASAQYGQTNRRREQCQRGSESTNCQTTTKAVCVPCQLGALYSRRFVGSAAASSFLVSLVWAQSRWLPLGAHRATAERRGSCPQGHGTSSARS